MENSSPGRRSLVDIEDLVQWAIERSGHLPWARTRDRDLAFDRGLDVKLRRRPAGSWALAEACAGLRLGNGRPIAARMTPSGDATAVIAAIKTLADARAAALIVACGRGKIRPDWMPGVVPVRVAKAVSHRRRRPNRKAQRWVWEPCDPLAIRAAREAYTCWHNGLRQLVQALQGRLEGWEIDGLWAPARPWEADLKIPA